MSRAIVKVGPADHGKRMSLDDFDKAEVQEGYLYELSRGVVAVTDVPGRRHLAQVDAIRQQFYDYRARHPKRIGAEVVGQGGGKDGSKSNSFQVGPTFEYGWTPQFRTTLAGGWKTVGGPIFTSRDNATYAKLEFSFSP